MLSRELAALRERSGNDTVALSGLRAECDALARQTDTLRRMEEHFEGYNNSVRHIMQCCADGRLSAAGGCGRVYGPVSKLIEVDGRYVTAIETALGAAIQNIVVDDEDTVRRLLNVSSATAPDAPPSARYRRSGDTADPLPARWRKRQGMPDMSALLPSL